MDAIDAIMSRRSIRRYTVEPVPEKVVGELLQAAMSAPSANNAQPWHFVIIDDRQVLDEIPKCHPYSQMLREASWAIVVCGDLGLEISTGFWVQDCSAATENILIAAQAKGLGAVWLGVYPREERIRSIQELLRLPSHIIPLCIVSLGYPAEKKPGGNRFSLARVHRNHW